MGYTFVHPHKPQNSPVVYAELHSTRLVCFFGDSIVFRNILDQQEKPQVRGKNPKGEHEVMYTYR